MCFDSHEKCETVQCSVSGYQGFQQLDGIGSQHDPHLRIIGGHRETLEGHGIQMSENKRLKHAS